MFEVYVSKRNGWENVGSFNDVESARIEALDVHYGLPACPITEVRNELGRTIHRFDMVGD